MTKRDHSKGTPLFQKIPFLIFELNEIPDAVIAFGELPLYTLNHISGILTTVFYKFIIILYT